MAAALPRPLQLKLERTLAQWRHWQCETPLSAAPEFVRLLGGGHSNCSVLVASDDHYVVRIDGISLAVHGLSRQREWRIMQTARRAGLAPRPCYFNPDLGSLVCEYLPPDREHRQSPAEIAGLLRGIHDLAPCHTRLDLRERILRYERQVAHGERQLPADASRYREQILECIERRSAQRPRLVLCHNDLLRANRLTSGGTLWAIDWEYSAMGDPWYDLAAVICGDELSAAASGRLVDAYLGRSPSEDESGALLDYCAVYRYLELLWYLALEHPAMDEPRQVLAIEQLAQAVEAVSP